MEALTKQNGVRLLGKFKKLKKKVKTDLPYLSFYKRKPETHIFFWPYPKFIVLYEKSCYLKFKVLYEKSCYPNFIVLYEKSYDPKFKVLYEV